MYFLQRISLSCYLQKIVTITGFWFHLAWSLSYINFDFYVYVRVIIYAYMYIIL